MTPLVSYLSVWLLINLSHVAGHLLVTSVFGVAVDRVSLGLGPTLWSRRWGRTTFRIALLPVAFLVRLRTRWKDGDEGVWPPSDAQDLRSRNLVVRAVVFASAPTSLLVLALASAFVAAGLERTEADDRPVVGGVAAGMPAASAGIQAGDLILAVDGERPETWLDVVLLLGSAGDGPVRLEVQRGQEILTLDVEPYRSPIDDRPIIGIVPGTITFQRPGLLARAEEAVTAVAGYGSHLLQGFTPPRTRVRTVAGPIAISSIAAERAGAALTFWRTATYLPLTCFAWCVVLPYLDGRRFLFLLVEALVRRPIHPKHEQRFNLVWLVIVAGLNIIGLTVCFVL